jgi:hypothetical protein
MLPLAEATTEQSIQCPRCSATDNTVTVQTFSNGTAHRRCTCAQCGTFLRFLPQPLDPGHKPVLHFGKHRGTPLEMLPGDYLEWVAANVRLSTRQRYQVKAELARRQVVGV